MIILKIKHDSFGNVRRSMDVTLKDNEGQSVLLEQRVFLKITS